MGMTEKQRQIVAEIEALDRLPKRSQTEELIERRQHLLALLRIEGDLHLLPTKLRLEAMETQSDIELVPRKFRNRAVAHDYDYDRIEDERSDLKDPNRIRARQLAHKADVLEQEELIRERGGSVGWDPTTIQLLLGFAVVVVLGFGVLHWPRITPTAQAFHTSTPQPSYQSFDAIAAHLPRASSDEPSLTAEEMQEVDEHDCGQHFHGPMRMVIAIRIKCGQPPQ